jgi:hypothetical protein
VRLLLCSQAGRNPPCTMYLIVPQAWCIFNWILLHMKSIILRKEDPELFWNILSHKLTPNVIFTFKNSMIYHVINLKHLENVIITTLNICLWQCLFSDK